MVLTVLRPFKVGDMISVGGVTGDVREIGLFATAMDANLSRTTLVLSLSGSAAPTLQP